MTTFEGLILLAAFAAVIIIAVGVDVIAKKLKEIIDKQYANWEQLRKIDAQIAGIWRGQDKIENNTAILSSIVDKMHRNLCVEIADKMVDRIYPDKESMNKIEWDKLSKEQQDEFLKRLILPNYDSPFQPPFNPTCETTNKED